MKFGTKRMAGPCTYMSLVQVTLLLVQPIMNLLTK